MSEYKEKLQKFLIQENIHMKLIFVLVVLCAYGALMVFSASNYICSQKEIYDFDSMYMLKRQVLFMLGGFAIVLASLFLDAAKIAEECTIVIYLVGYIFIFLLLTPLGVTSHGATRWIRLGVQFQVAEVVKISVVVMLAYMVKKFKKHLTNPKLTIYMWLAGGIPAILLYATSNDLSSSVVVLAMVFGITFITNGTIKMHLGVLGVAVAAVGAYVYSIAKNLPTPDELETMSFRVGRIAAWIDPKRYASGKGMQTLNSLYAIGSGGIFGKGIGESYMKLGPIPEPQNDMIFAIIVEELGLFGGSVLIFLFMYLLYLLFRVIIKVNSIYESTLVLGVLIHIGVQAFFNIGVALNALPNTGIGLPFISYGGTAILCLMVEMALVCSIAKKEYIKSVKKAYKNSKVW